MLRATGYILKNFLQDFKHEKFPATGRSHGRVGFHALFTFKNSKFVLLFNIHSFD